MREGSEASNKRVVRMLDNMIAALSIQSMRGSKKRTMQLLRGTMGEGCKLNEERKKRD